MRQHGYPGGEGGEGQENGGPSQDPSADGDEFQEKGYRMFRPTGRYKCPKVKEHRQPPRKARGLIPAQQAVPVQKKVPVRQVPV